MEALERAFVAANRWALIALLAAMACIVFANVALRYLTNESLVWAEEVARHLMIWLTFLGAGLVLRFGGHIAIENLHDVLPGRAGRWLRASIVAALLVFFAVMAWQGAVYTSLTRFQTTAATGISFGWVYMAMPLGFVLLIAHLLLVARRYVLERRVLSSDEIDAGTAASL
jgi:TRAP-type C4-dicarboxylate transport system permease small subunit